MAEYSLLLNQEDDENNEIPPIVTERLQQNSSTSVIFRRFDQVLATVGSFSHYQINLILYVQLISIVFTANVVFMPYSTYVPEVTCTLPRNASGNRSAVSFVYDKNSPQAFCQHFDECKRRGHIKWTAPLYTLVEEWQLICDLDHVPQTINSVQQLGSFFAVCASGPLADMYGRKTVFVPVYIGMIVFGFAGALVSSWQLLIFCRFVAGGLFSAATIVMMVWSVECCGSSDSFYMNIGGLWAASYMVTSLIGYWTANWRLYLLVVNFLAIILLAGIVYFVESPRWLIQNRKFDQAARSFNSISQKNHQSSVKVLTAQNIDQISVESDADFRKFSVSKLCASRTLSFYTALFVVVTVTTKIAVDTFIMQISQLPGSPFMKFAVFGLLRTWIPLAIIYFNQFPSCGRRHMLLLPTALICASYVFVFLNVSLNSTPEALTFIGTLVAALLTNFNWAAIAQFKAEIFPTTIRNTAISVVFIFDGAVGILVPQLVYFEKYWQALPFLVISVLAGFSLFCGYCFLPETKGKHLPENMDHVS